MHAAPPVSNKAATHSAVDAAAAGRGVGPPVYMSQCAHPRSAARTRAEQLLASCILKDGGVIGARATGPQGARATLPSSPGRAQDV
jgi:hypothetical protein